MSELKKILKVLLLKKFERFFASSKSSPARTEAVEKFSETSSARVGPDNTKIFISHGRFDSIIDIEEGRRIKQTLQKQGFDLFYKEYDIGHEISADVIEDLSNWLEKN